MQLPFVQRLNSPTVAWVLPAALYLAFILAHLAQHGWDPSFFVQAGDMFVMAGQAPAHLTILAHSAGYDGQFYYRLALDPFTREKTAFGITLDIPPYRQQRVLYPLIVFLLSAGYATVVPVLLIVVNFVSICVMGWLGGLYMQWIGRHALWGGIFPLYAGFILVLARNLAEILSVTLILACLVCLQRRRQRAGIAWLSLAVLAKETSLLVAVALLFAHPAEKWYDRLIPGFRMLPLFLFFLWQVWLFVHWGMWPLSAAPNNLGWPFAGVAGFVQQIAVSPDRLQSIWLFEIGLILLSVLAACSVYRTTTAGPLEQYAWLLYAILVASLTRAVWVEDWAFLRASAELVLFGTILVLNGPATWQRVVVAASAVWWVLLAIDVVFYRS
jgi:hypothetical protein